MESNAPTVSALICCCGAVQLDVNDPPDNCPNCDALSDRSRANLNDEGRSAELMMVAVVSTSHLSALEARCLPNSSGDGEVYDFPLPCMGWEYGAIVYVGDGRNVIESSLDREGVALWPGLLAACDWAAKNGFDWIRFDSDADPIVDLPRWDW